MQQTGPVISSHGLTALGLDKVAAAHWNYGSAALIEEAVRRNEGSLSKDGAFVAITAPYTGRSPNDKFIVRDAVTAETVDWGKVNQSVEPAVFDNLLAKLQRHLAGKEVFVRDCYCGTDPDHRLPLRVVTEQAWHNLFAGNMFVDAPHADLAAFVPQFTVLQAPSFQADPKVDGTNSEAFVIVDFSKRMVIIGGTRYAGEIKKSVFGAMNFFLPEQGILPMHCSANMDADGNTAIFFGLSGTGKTTLSADASRELIGDDEHGWGPNGVFNFEGGCYAKTIKLNPEAEPEIYATTKRFGTVLENVVMDPLTRTLDLDDNTITENTRASYPIEFIPNASATGRGNQPKTIVMLTADAFGVLPPISKLTPEQAMYHFLSGYTAKVAGTERGVKEPTATFSSCFGAPFMPRHPTVYAKLLGDLMRQYGAQCWLVNTGWTGGGYGVGERMSIKHTRALLNAALSGALAEAPMAADPYFGVHVPTVCAGVPDEVLQPRNTWKDKAAYDKAAQDVVARFAKNFAPFEDKVDAAITAAGMKAAA